MLIDLSKREIEQIVDALDEQVCDLQSSEDIRAHLQYKFNKLIVACGNKSSLEIKYLQKSGKNIMSIKDFLNGTKISIGEKFGS